MTSRFFYPSTTKIIKHIIIRRTCFLYYFSVYVNLFKDRFLLWRQSYDKTYRLAIRRLVSNIKVSLFLNADAKVYILSQTSKCFKRKFQKSWITTTYTLYNIRPTKSSSFHHLSTFIHSKTTRKMLASTRPNLKAQGPTRQKATINPRFTSPKTAITTLLARKSYALTLPKHSFHMVITALLHAKSIAFRWEKPC